MNSLTKIETSIVRHKEEVLKHLKDESQLVGVFLYGSQNYQLAIENSDVDTVAIILPTERELYFETPVTKEIHLDNGEHIVVKDIREYMKMVKKQNINFLEILFTKFSWVNPRYQILWNCFLVHRERLTIYDSEKAIKSIIGQAKHTLIQAQATFDNKKYANALKMYYFLDKFLNSDLPYAEKIIPTKEEKKEILAYKKGEKTVDVGMIVDLANKFNNFSNSYFIIPQEEKETLDEMINYFMHGIIKKCIDKNPF